MKNLLKSLFLATLLLVSCTQHEELEAKTTEKTNQNASRLQFGENVKLIKVLDQNYSSCSRAGCYYYHERDYVVEVANLAYNKKVQIHQQLKNGQWEDFDLTYAYTTSNGNEIWKGKNLKSISGLIPNDKYFGEQLAVKFTVNNTTYWDNNQNNNYFINYANRPVGVRTLYLVNSLNIINQPEYSYMYSYDNTSYFYLIAELKNIAFAKEVKVIYTTNNWASSNSLPLVHVSYLNYLNNEHESWFGNFSIPLTQSITYYLSYKVNGITYYDNNFGKNYKLTIN